MRVGDSYLEVRPVCSYLTLQKLELNSLKVIRKLHARAYSVEKFARDVTTALSGALLSTFSALLEITAANQFAAFRRAASAPTWPLHRRLSTLCMHEGVTSMLPQSDS